MYFSCLEKIACFEYIKCYRYTRTRIPDLGQRKAYFLEINKKDGGKRMKKSLILGICFALTTAFTAVDVSAHPKCGKVWIEGHHNKHGRWIEGHWRHSHWVKGHYNRHGEWISGHCSN
jgi:hypothetical protein